MLNRWLCSLKPALGNSGAERFCCGSCFLPRHVLGAAVLRALPAPFYSFSLVDAGFFSSLEHLGTEPFLLLQSGSTGPHTPRERPGVATVNRCPRLDPCLLCHAVSSTGCICVLTCPAFCVLTCPDHSYRRTNPSPL